MLGDLVTGEVLAVVHHQVALADAGSRSLAGTLGRCLIDAEVLRAAGEQDLSRSGGGPTPIVDLFVDEMTRDTAVVDVADGRG